MALYVREKNSITRDLEEKNSYVNHTGPKLKRTSELPELYKFIRALVKQRVCESLSIVIGMETFHATREN